MEILTLSSGEVIWGGGREGGVAPVIAKIAGEVVSLSYSLSLFISFSSSRQMGVEECRCIGIIFNGCIVLDDRVVCNVSKRAKFKKDVHID